MAMTVLIGVIAMVVFSLGFVTGVWWAGRGRPEDFRNTSDWEPDPLPPLNESALADLGAN